MKYLIAMAVAGLLITSCMECKNESHLKQDEAKDQKLKRDSVIIDSLKAITDQSADEQLGWYQIQWEQITDEGGK